MKLRLPTLALFAALPTLALAHPGHEGGHDFGWDFTGGLAHPVFGWDHLLAMVTVGLWAARLGGRARFLLPGTFVATLIGGAAAAQAGLQLGGVEQTIAASLIVLGLGLALSRPLPVVAAASATALFGFAHGLAHGVEIPIYSNVWAYLAGFAVSSAILHTIGLAAGQVLHSRMKVQQAIGTGVALAGVVALVA